MKIGDSVVMIGGTTGGDHAAPAPAHLYLLVDDVDASYQQALDAGANAVPGQVERAAIRTMDGRSRRHNAISSSHAL